MADLDLKYAKDTKKRLILEILIFIECWIGMSSWYSINFLTFQQYIIGLNILMIIAVFALIVAGDTIVNQFTHMAYAEALLKRYGIIEEGYSEKRKKNIRSTKKE